MQGFLKRHGIVFKRRMNKGDLLTLLEKDDVHHPDAASEDGFIDEDLKSTDVVMDDVE